jgi:hypothetical protein
MDEVYILALLNRVKEDSIYLQKLPEDIQALVIEKLNEDDIS